MVVRPGIGVGAIPGWVGVRGRQTWLDFSDGTLAPLEGDMVSQEDSRILCSTCVFPRGCLAGGEETLERHNTQSARNSVPGNQASILSLTRGDLRSSPRRSALIRLLFPQPRLPSTNIFRVHSRHKGRVRGHEESGRERGCRKNVPWPTWETPCRLELRPPCYRAQVETKQRMCVGTDHGRGGSRLCDVNVTPKKEKRKQGWPGQHFLM